MAEKEILEKNPPPPILLISAFTKGEIFMNSSQEIAGIIRVETKRNKINISKMLFDLNLGKNVMSHLDNGSMLKAESLFKIADYLDISIDYLLGRVENPNVSGNRIEGNNNDIQGGKNNIITVNGEKLISKRDFEFLEKINSLDFDDYAFVVNFVNEKSKRERN